MNPAFATTILFLLGGVLFLLPMLPAIVELRLKRDAQPLDVIQLYAGDIRHFAYGFREYVQRLSEPLQVCVESGESSTATLPGGDKCLLLGNKNITTLTLTGEKNAVCPFVVVGGVGLVLPGGLTFPKEVYAAGDLRGGEGNIYRAILGEKSIHLSRANRLMRWAHAVGRFQADQNCDLFGRISSETEIVLQSGCTFQRLNAPRILAGENKPAAPQDAIAIARPVGEPLAPQQFVSRKLFDEDVEIGPGEIFRGNLVTRGKLHIGAGAQVLGSVKSNKDMVIEEGVLVTGSLVSAGRMRIGPGCQVHGPVLAERDLIIATGTACGEEETPTTVSALSISVEEGVTVFGTLWARDIGQVISR